MVAVAAVVIVGVIVGLHPTPVADMADAAICTVKTQAPCAAGASGTGGATTNPPGDNGDRRDQEGQTRDDRRGRGSDKSPTDPNVGGTSNGGDPLGPPVSGTSVTEPQPPDWKPADGGAGEYDSQRAWPWDHAKKVAIEAAANLLAGKWPDASRNLSHYLGNTGEPLEQDVNRLLEDVPLLQAEVDRTRTALGEDAVAQAQASGATGPVTFPLSTDWKGYYIGSDQSQNWFYAMGGISYNQTGQVTVYPPTSPGGPWRYVVTSRVNIYDQYNWDGGKSTNIGPITITDDEMARLHRQGLAREYRNQGRSDTTTSEGTVP
jgi:hypothetical protein